MKNDRKLLLLLSGAFVLDHMDRHILSITLDQIGREFALSDLQLGALSGLAFAIVFTLLGFPVALITRPGRRKAIAISALTAWSAMTVAMAAAGSYAHLLLARMGVAVGEAGYTPAAHSMVADQFPEERRAGAFAVFSAGSNIGLFLAFLVGGVVAANFGWRVAFLVAGAPGLLLAIVLWFTLREPPSPPKVAPEELTPSLRQVWRMLASEASTLLVLIGAVLTATVNYGGIVWTATFLIREHGLRVDQAGLFLAVVAGLCGGVMTFLFGQFADRLGARNPSWRLGLIGVTLLVAKGVAIIAFSLSDTRAALIVLAIPAMLGGVYLGPTFAHIYSRIDPAARPRATAIIVFLLNLVGLGLGPLFVGAVSTMTADAATGQGDLALGLILVQCIGIVGAILFLKASRRLPALGISGGKARSGP